jgi:hypothetical protein
MTHGELTKELAETFARRAKYLIECCDGIRVEENVDGRPDVVVLSSLPAKLAIKHALKLLLRLEEEVRPPALPAEARVLTEVPKATYEMSEDGNTLKCMICKSTTSNPHYVLNRLCPTCHWLHEQGF